MSLAILQNLLAIYKFFLVIDSFSCTYSVSIFINYTAQFCFIMFLTFIFSRFKLVKYYTDIDLKREINK